MLPLAQRPNLVGFFSYSRRDDKHSQGSLSRLRTQIYDELRLQLPRDLRLWQDIEAIPHGAKWEDEIKRAIAEAVFFIPIITPNAIASEHCRFEFDAFLAREAALDRSNLIFPLLYVRVPELEKEELWRQDHLLEIIGRRQYLDWQKFRYRNVAETESAEQIGKFCRNIVESLQQPWTSLEERRAAEAAEAQRAADRALREEARKQQQAGAEAGRKAERERGFEAEAQRVADQAGRRAAEESHRQEKKVGHRPQEAGQPPAGARLVALIVLVTSLVLFFYFLQNS